MKILHTIINSDSCIDINLSNNAVFFDIETTGLSPASSVVYLIGAFQIRDHTPHTTQWFAEAPSEEAALLAAFSEYLLSQKASQLVSYNGDRFDLPFLKARYHQTGTAMFSGLTSLDLYPALRPLKALLKLPAQKQTTLEQVLRLPERVYPDGAAGTRLYFRYLTETDTQKKDQLLLALTGHNLEDLRGLSCIPSLLSCLDLWKGDYEIENLLIQESEMIFHLRLSHTLPLSLSNGNAQFYLTGAEQRVKLLIHAAPRGYRYYHSNYRDYDYIPSEDMALPKSLSGFLDRSLRKKAGPQTCYTWFQPNPEFLSNPEMQKQYLLTALPRLLETL